MIEIDRASDRLRVRTRPSPSYRVITWAVWIAALATASIVDRPFGYELESAAGGAVLGTPFLVALGLLLGWTTTECRFDRISGLLVVSRTSPMRGTRFLEVPFASVCALVERSAVGGRRLELVLADDTTVVLARADDPTGAVLGSVAREVGQWLGKPVRLARGTLIAGRFEIDQFVAQGGIGVVYRAHDRTTSQAVALKLSLASNTESSTAERFAREMRLLASLEHPGIARYVSSGISEGGQAYLAMEWLEGEDLARSLERGPLSLADSVTLLKAAAQAAAAAHSRGMIHRDLKPSNLFLRNRAVDQAVLLDFGVARRSETGTLLTGARAIVGTPHYMAPEQAMNAGQLTPAADVFSLGCIFYECLTGQRPFAAEHPVGVLARILYDQPEPIASVERSVPEAWSAFAERLLAKDPAARPTDGAAVVQELLQLEAASTPAPRSSIPPRDRPRDSGAIDQVFASVVLATLPARHGEEPPARSVDALRSAIQRFGCPIEQLADGSILATVLPRASSADQVRIAARCALYLREQLPDARIAVATGYAPFGAGPRVGAAVDRAAHLLEPTIAQADIRVDTVSAGLLDRHFTLLEQFGAITLIGEQADIDETRPLLGKPTVCIGRAIELGQLEAALASVIEEATPKSAIVLGPPGIGKSRLRHELLRRIREQQPGSVALIGYGDPLSAGSPYVLVSDALRRRADIQVGADRATSQAQIAELCSRIEPQDKRRVSEFLGELCGVPFPAEDNPQLLAARADRRVMNEQITRAVRDWLAAECAVRPVVLVLEDVQWGDALTVKVVQAALRDIARGALFVVAFGRPETEETFPGLFSQNHALSLTLPPLSSAATESLVKGVLGETLGADTLARIVELAAGNALFLEELIRAAAAGKIDGASETVLAMLQARLSQLPPEPRALLRAASVLGTTFWRGGLARIVQRWGEIADADGWMERLVKDEVVVRQRSSRYLGDVEYRFRHALLGDAARGLLTANDLRTAHLDAAAWRQAVGEEDRIVLARHIEAGGERERAIEYYSRAAEQSLERCDSAEAIARAERAIACGASGAVLSQMYAIQTVAYFDLGDWTTAASRGLAALEIVPRGGAAWCSVVEALTQVLPNVGDPKRAGELSAELLRITPPPEVRSQYLRTVHVQLMGFALAAAHAEGRACLAFLDAQPDAEPDVLTRGYSKLWRAVFMVILGDEPLRACRLARGAQRDLEASRALYRLSLAHTVEGFAAWACGDLAAAASAAKRGHAIAQDIRDDYHAALAMWHLGLALSESKDPGLRREAGHCARVVQDLQSTPVLGATSQSLSARVAQFDEDWPRAEEYGRKSRTRMAGAPAYRFIAATAFITALVRLGRHAEAAASAREDLAILDRLDGPLCTEVMLRVAAAEALFADGHPTTAHAVLQRALAAIDHRAAKLNDPALVEIFRNGREENRRAAELARDWLGAKAG